MQHALVEISTFHAIEPAAIFRRIVELLVKQYPGAMAMINLIEGERIGFRDVANPHPAFQERTSVDLRDSY